MKKIKSNFIKPTKLQKQIFIAYLLLSFIIVVFFSTFFYRYTSKILIDRETNSLIDVISTINQQTDQVIREMDTVSINIEYSNLAKEKLENSIKLSNSSDDFLALTQLFVAINGTDSRVDQINLYDFNGNVIRVGLTTNMYKVDIDSLPWLPDVMELNGSKYLSIPYISDHNNHPIIKPSCCISLYRIFHNKYGKEIGIVETSKNCKSIFKNIITYQKKNDNSPNFYVYNNEGALIYPYDLTKTNDQLPNYNYFTQVDKNANHTLIEDSDTGSKELVTYVRSNYTNWTYVSVQPEDMILSPVNQLVKKIIFFSFLIFLFAMFLSLIMAKKLTKPISQLKRVLNKTSIDTLGQADLIKVDKSFDEFTQLTHAFEQMSQNLKHSMNELVETRQQEVKSRSLALQSQINPHFYYNTLATIQVLSENQDHENIRSMCKYLTSIMRYITKGSFSTVTLEAEIDYVKKYLYCMKIRYQDSLNYDIQIPDELLQEEVPKLIIQPLVENAMKYGTECLPPWNIKIVGSITDERWQIKITDTGPGFDSEALTLIEQRIEDASNKIGMPEIEINGMGLLNVYLRWKLHCKESTFFDYGNDSLGHAFVTIGKKASIKREDM